MTNQLGGVSSTLNNAMVMMTEVGICQIKIQMHHTCCTGGKNMICLIWWNFLAHTFLNT